MFNKSPAAQQIEKHNDGLDALKSLIDLVKNPDAIYAAHKVAREETKLTEEQQKEYQHAVEYIEAYPKLVEAIKKAQDELTKDQELHATNVDADRKKIKDENAELERAKNQIEIGRRENAVESKRLVELEKALRKKYSDLATPLDDQAAQNKKDAEANLKEKIRLEKLAAKLKKQADGVKAAINTPETDETEE